MDSQIVPSQPMGLHRATINWSWLEGVCSLNPELISAETGSATDYKRVLIEVTYLKDTHQCIGRKLTSDCFVHTKHDVCAIYLNNITQMY